jgi:hypothetical protein
VIDDELYLLNEEEIAAIRVRERFAIGISAFLGAMGVLLLYLPYYLFPAWFPDMMTTVVSYRLAVPVNFMLYSILLVAIEIFLLTLLNIWCAHEIAVATGFLNYKNKLNPDKHNMLLDIGLEKKNKKVLSYGIDPLLGINRKALIFWNAMFIMKATLSNMVFRFLIQRFTGRHLIRALQDFAGIPIFAFWNAYGTKILLREARVIIMGQNLIEEIIRKIDSEGGIPTQDKELISDTLQFIAICKRDFHQNHYILARNLFEQFDLPEPQTGWTEEEYIRKLDQSGEFSKKICSFFITLGLLLDGRISTREQKKIARLREIGIIPFSPEQMKMYCRSFIEGRGAKELFSAFFGSRA